MLRFIDLRYQGTASRFAFFWTSDDQFQSLDGEMTWDTWDEFESDFLSSRPGQEEELKRYKTLCPAWVFGPSTGEEEDLDFDPPYAYLEVGGERYPIAQEPSDLPLRLDLSALHTEPSALTLQSVSIRKK